MHNNKGHTIQIYNQTYSDIPLYKVLQYGRRYAVDKEYTKLFQIYCPENLNEIYFDNWLYYASHSPLWASRIIEYGGMIDEENRKIIFENDDLEEEFYNKWNYEPDEQPLKTHQQAMGLKKNPENNLETFCNQYGYKILSL